MAITATEYGSLTQQLKSLQDQLAKVQANGGEITKQDKLANEALEIISRIPVPTADQMKLVLDRAVEVGQITPQQAQNIFADDSMWKSIVIPESLKQQQYAVINRLGEIANAGGMDAQTKAKLEQINQETATAERGAREAITQQAAQRGRSGGGLEFAQKMLAQQLGAQTRALQGTQAASDAEQRALQALIQGGQLAGQVRGQEFGEQSDVAKARQAIQQFNVANQLQTQQQNISNDLAAQQANQAEKARVQQLNLAQQKAEAQQAASNPEALYGMQMQKAGQLAGIKTQQAGEFQQAQLAQSAQQQAASEASKNRQNALMGGLIAAGGFALSDKNKKENIKELNDSDIEELLNKITGYKYNYKGDNKPTAGVMAQDLEDSKVGKGLIVDTPEGKFVDANKTVGALAGALAQMNKRLNKVEGKK